MKINRKQIKSLIENYGQIPDDLNLQVAMRIKDMMPPEEALRMHDDDIYDLVVDIYDKEFDTTKEKEGWDPYPEDIEEIRDHLTLEDEMAESHMRENMAMRNMMKKSSTDAAGAYSAQPGSKSADSRKGSEPLTKNHVVKGAFKGTSSDRAQLNKDLEAQIKKMIDSGKEDQVPENWNNILMTSDGDHLIALQKAINPGFFKKIIKSLFPEGTQGITESELRSAIREAYNSMSPAGKGLANSIKGKFMRLYPDAKVGIDGRGGFITVNGKKALDMSQATSTRMSDEEMIEKMHAVYAGEHVDDDVSTADSRMGTFREGTIRTSERQLRKIIREAVDMINRETGEVITFGERHKDVAPDKAVNDIMKRLGISPKPEEMRTSGADGFNIELSNDDFMKIEDETVGKQDSRARKKKSAQMAADRERLNIDNLLQKLRYWAEDAARDYMGDNPGTDLQDIAYDLADAWESEFEADEREELMWHFDGDLNDLKIYAAESMG